MKKSFVALVTALMLIGLFGTEISAQGPTYRTLNPAVVIDTPTSTITTTTADTTEAPTSAAVSVNVQWKFGTVVGTYTTCTVQAKTTYDGTTWLTLGSATSVTVTTGTVNAWSVREISPSTASATVATSFGISTKFTFACSGAYGTSAPVTLSTIYKVATASAAAGSGGIGDVVGPSSATDNAIARFDSTTGKLIQNSAVFVSDNKTLFATAPFGTGSLASAFTEMIPATQATSPFIIAQSGLANAGDAMRDDETITVGFNAGTGGRVNGSDHAVRQVMESYYKPGGGVAQAEIYLEYLTHSAGTVYRPHAVNIERSEPPLITSLWDSDVYHFRDVTGMTNLFNLSAAGGADFNVNLNSDGTTTLNDATYINAQTRINLTGTPVSIGDPGYALSVQNIGGNYVYVEFLNNGGAGKGGFFGIGNNNIELGNAQAGDIIFYAGAVGGTEVARMPNAGGIKAPVFLTSTNCVDSAGAAACGSAAAGAFVIDAAATTVVVSTTAVTANSEIIIQEDSSLFTRLGIGACNATPQLNTVSARTAATSFTVSTAIAPVTNPRCYNYWIIN